MAGGKKKSPFDVSGKVVVLTGAGGLLGRDFARMLAENGANVVLVGRDKAKLEPLCAEVKALGTDPLVVPADISDKAQVKKMVDAVLAKYGRIDCLINNAVFSPKPGDKGYFSKAEDYPEDAWNRAISVNLTGLFFCCQEAGKLMVKQGGGSIVNIASIYGVVSPHHPIYEKLSFNSPVVYGVTKAGVIQLTRYLGAYWAKKGVRVNCISPGGVFNSQSPEFLKEYEPRAPAGRMAKPEEIAAAVLFLCSGGSAYMNGHNLVVDGGWTIW